MLNATQWTGLLVIALAAIFCFRARRPRPWRFLALLHALLFVEVIAGFRYRLHDLVNTGLMASGLYQQRSGTQIALLIGLALIALIVTIIVFRQNRSMARIGLLSSGGLVLLFLAETVSLHQVDALLYRPVGPVFVIAILWASLCLVTAGAALLDRPTAPRRQQRRRSGRLRNQRR